MFIITNNNSLSLNKSLHNSNANFLRHASSTAEVDFLAPNLLVKVIRHTTKDKGCDGKESGENLRRGDTHAATRFLTGCMQGRDVIASVRVLVVSNPIGQTSLALASLGVYILTHLK